MPENRNRQPNPYEEPSASPAATREGSAGAVPIPISRQDRLVVTVGEAAQLLGISRAFAYELVARGDLPVIRLGRRRLVPKEALRALVEGDRGDPMSQTAWVRRMAGSSPPSRVDLHPDVPADVYRPRPGVVDTRQDDAQHANG